MHASCQSETGPIFLLPQPPRFSHRTGVHFGGTDFRKGSALSDFPLRRRFAAALKRTTPDVLLLLAMARER